MANIELNGSAQTGSALTITAPTEVVILNNSKSTLNVTLVHSVGSVDDINLILDGGQGFSYHPGTAGTLTPTVTPRHTGIAASLVADAPDGVPQINDAIFIYSAV